MTHKNVEVNIGFPERSAIICDTGSMRLNLEAAMGRGVGIVYMVGRLERTARYGRLTVWGMQERIGEEEFL